MSFIKNKKIWIGAGAAILIVATALVLLVATTGNNEKEKAAAMLNTYEEADRKTAEFYALVYDISIERVVALKTELKDWEEVNKQLMNKKYTISKEEKSKLYDEGYAADDIEMSEQIAAQTGKSAIDILKSRGKISDGLKEWADVEKELNLDTRSQAAKLGMTEVQIKALQKKKYSDTDIDRIAVIIFNSKKTYESVVKQLDSGTSIDEIEKSIFGGKQK